MKVCLRGQINVRCERMNDLMGEIRGIIPDGGLSHLDHPHVEAGLLGQLLPDVSGGFGGGSERRLQRLQLFGLDGGAGAASLAPEVLVVVLVVHRLLVGQGGDLRVLEHHVVLELVLRVRG